MKKLLPGILIALFTLGTTAAQTPTNPNLALDGAVIATASSVYANPDFSPSGAIDGDRKGLYWGSGGGWNDNTKDIYSDTFTLNFPRRYLIGCVVLVSLQDDFNNPQEPTPTQTCQSYGINEFDVEARGASGAFNPVASVLFTHFKCINTVAISPPVRTDGIRFTIHDAQGEFSRIVEAEVYRTCPAS